MEVLKIIIAVWYLKNKVLMIIDILKNYDFFKYLFINL